MGKLYSRIILGTDLGPQSLYIGQQAKQLALLCQAELIILHVVEASIAYTAHFAEQNTNLKKSQENAYKSLQAFCTKLSISEDQALLKTGTPQDTLLETVSEKHCDLVIVGSHGVGGYTHLLGSTAHHLLEHAPCNVLIVQVTHLKKEIQTTMPKDKFLWQQPFLLDAPTQYGSAHGFGEVVKRGPRLTKRPATSPYKGGTRTRTSDNEDKDKS